MFYFCQAVLYANLSRVPTLLPSQRSEDQTKQAYKMLSDCFRFVLNTFSANFLSPFDIHSIFTLISYRYGMNTTCCRAKTLVEYFGEDFCHQSCILYVCLLFI